MTEKRIALYAPSRKGKNDSGYDDYKWDIKRPLDTLFPKIEKKLILGNRNDMIRMR